MVVIFAKKQEKIRKKILFPKEIIFKKWKKANSFVSLKIVLVILIFNSDCTVYQYKPDKVI